MKKGRIKDEDRIVIFRILYPEAAFDIDCYKDVDWVDILDQWHIPKYRTKAHFISELVDYVGRIKKPQRFE
jgi:hypothetical protein